MPKEGPYVAGKDDDGRTVYEKVEEDGTSWRSYDCKHWVPWRRHEPWPNSDIYVVLSNSPDGNARIEG